jgi:hypothetical protein
VPEQDPVRGRADCGQEAYLDAFERSLTVPSVFALKVASMTDNSTNKSGADAESASGVVALGSPDEEVALPEELNEIDDDGSDQDDVPGTGAVSGGFGFAGLALAIVSLTTNWTSSVVVSHAQFNEEAHAPSSGLTAQQDLDLYANGWHTQGWWALVFAAAAVLFGAGALLWPRSRLSGGTPGWAKAAATSAIIVGLLGALLAILTITGVFGGHLTAPAGAG